MKKQNIINQLQSILIDKEYKLTKKDKIAISEAIRKIEEKGELDPAWIAVILQALNIGLDLLQKGP